MKFPNRRTNQRSLQKSDNSDHSAPPVLQKLPMNVSLYQAAAAMNASTRWQEVVAGNLASSMVPGYKRQAVSFEAVAAGALNEARAPVMPRAVMSTNFNSGEMQTTGVGTDLAIDGPAFFEVQLSDGSLAYTRDGTMRISGSGQLQTKQGFALQGQGGPVQTDPNEKGALTISPDGDVSQGDVSRGRLRLVEFADPRALRPIGQGLYVVSNPGVRPQEASNSSVRQGFIEAANSTPVHEMAELILSMRQFEANQKVLQMHDERMGKAIAELGNPSAS